MLSEHGEALKSKDRSETYLDQGKSSSLESCVSPEQLSPLSVLSSGTRVLNTVPNPGRARESVSSCHGLTRLGELLLANGGESAQK